MTRTAKINAMRKMEGCTGFNDFKEGEAYILDLIKKDLLSEEYDMGQIIVGDYVFSPCKNGFNDKTSYWVSKKGYTIAVYAFTPTSKNDLKEMTREDVLKSYINYLEQTIAKLV